MTIAQESWERAVEILDGANEVALACHVDPDGDALGSMLAFGRFLRSRGVRTWASWGSPTAQRAPLMVPPQYTFLPGLDDLISPEQFPQAPEVMVVFDCSTPQRLGTLRGSAEAAGTVIVVDHHASGVPFGDVRLVDGGAAATAVLVSRLIKRMGGELDKQMAVCLYVGLVTDTGRFQYASTTPEVMRLGAELIAHGIDHAAINRQVWDTHSFGYLKVLGRALARARMVPEAALAWTVIYQDDLDDLGVSMAETEGLIDTLRAVEAAEVSMVAKEQDDRRWRVSLRSRGAIDVGKVTQRLGGGGHTFIAGFVGTGTIEDVVDAVCRVLVDDDELSVLGSAPVSRPAVSRPAASEPAASEPPVSEAGARAAGAPPRAVVG